MAARPLTHVRLEDCFGEEHVVDIRTLPEDVQQAVQHQIEQTYGIPQAPLPRKEPGTIDEADVREWLTSLPLTDPHPLPPLLDTALSWTRKAKCRMVLDKVADFTPRVANLVPALLPRLPSKEVLDKDEESALLRSAILVLRLLRNLCPNSTINQNQMREAQVMETVLPFLKRIEDRTRLLQADEKPAKSHVESMRMALQLLANVTTVNPENQRHLWELIFPNALEDLLSITSDPQCLGHSCMLLYNCTHSQPQWRAMVAASRPHISAIVNILSSNVTHGDAFEWALLFIEALLKDGLLSQIYTTLGGATSTVSKAQVVLLKVLDGVTDRMTKASDGMSSTVLMPIDSYVSLTHEFKRLRDLFFQRRDSEISNPTEIFSKEDMEHTSDALFLLLQIFAAVASSDASVNAQLKTTLADAGLLRSVIETLGIIYRQEGHPERLRSDWEDPPAMKRDLVRVIANMVHSHQANQDLVRQLEGIPLVLNCCRVDDTNPYMREWGILAVRNLCEDNEANQQIISSMQFVGTADNPELTRMGLKVVMENGKFRLRKADE